MVTCSDSKVVMSNIVSMGIAPCLYTSSRGGVARSSESRAENLGVAVATFLAPEPGPQELQPLLVQMWVEG